MLEQFTCQVCRSGNVFTRNYDVTRCRRCGAVYSLVGGGEPSRISPDMQPIGCPGVYSPWMARQHRPTRTGAYECRFSCGVAQLQWDGRCFRFGRQRVQCRTLISWRGVWA
jgi:hypothetical protein